MLTRIKQWLCSHRFDLADMQPRDARGIVRCRCYKCGGMFAAEYGLALPGVFDRNTPAGVRACSCDQAGVTHWECNAGCRERRALPEYSNCCDKPINGWRCSRIKGHDGECDHTATAGVTAAEMTDTTVSRGTFACPICGQDTPHHHPTHVVAAYRDDQVRRDGWISTLVRLPKEMIGKFYLCRGHKIVPPPQDENEWRFREIHGMLWQRRTGHLMDAEVLQWDEGAQSFLLAQWTGSGNLDGRDTRAPVYVTPTHWRELPAFGKPSDLDSLTAEVNGLRAVMNDQRDRLLSILRYFGLPQRDYEALTLIQDKDAEHRAAMLKALDALQAAAAGLEWYRDHCPDQVNGSDDEADEQIGEALAALEGVLRTPAQGDAEGVPVGCTCTDGGSGWCSACSSDGVQGRPLTGSERMIEAAADGVALPRGGQA